MLSKFSIRKIINFKTGLIVGILGIAIGGTTLYGIWQAERSIAKPVKRAFTDSSITADNGQPLIYGTPSRISIPSVGINLQVIPGYFNSSNNSWTLSLTDAQYATNTRPNNNKQGLTFIYAHYRLGVFYTLPKIQPGAQAIVTTANGHTFTYTFRDSVVTSPQDTSLFTYKGKPILVLQTCTGLWYQYRQLFSFDLTKVS